MSDADDTNPATDTPLVAAEDFMCSCRDEGKARCAAVRARAREIVSASLPLDGDIDFVDRLLYDLTLKGDLTIISDQWALVAVKPFGSEHDEIHQAVRMQCDSIVDGLAAAVVFYSDYDAPEPVETATTG